MRYASMGPKHGRAARCFRGGGILFLLLPCAFLAFSATPLAAQSWNRAVFRGDEIDPRDFEFNPEYFMNVRSYSFAPDWEEAWQGSDKGYRLTVGSVRSDEFYLKQQVKLHLDVTEKVRFHYDLLQDEDYDTRYLRHRAALVLPVHDNWSVYGLAEGTAYKEDNDLGAGAIYTRGPHNWWELQLTGVDFNEEKGMDGRHFSKDAYGLLAMNEIPVSESVFIGGGIEFQLPMTMVDQGEDIEFHFDKKLYDAYLGWRAGGETEVRVFAGGERTGKNSDYFVDNASDQRLDRHSFGGGAEVLWRSDTPWEADYRAGACYFHFRERSLFPGDTAEDQKHERNEHTLFCGLTVQLQDDLFFRPMIFADYVSQNELFRNDPHRNDRYNGFQGKVSATLEFRFSDTARLTINPNLDLDEVNWGGGNVQVMILF